MPTTAPPQPRHRQAAAKPAVARAPAKAAALDALAIALPFGRVQAQLTVGPVNDAFETEADRVADEVAGATDAMAVSLAPKGGARPAVQRKCDACAEEDAEALQGSPSAGSTARRRISRLSASGVRQHAPAEAATGRPSEALGTYDLPDGVEAGIRALEGGGRPLSTAERAFFEPRFGYDFGQVRVHADERSADLTRAVAARAFTSGRDVVFGRGQLAPETPAGRRLLAHELTHVVQQGAAAPRTAPPNAPHRPAAAPGTSAPALSRAPGVVQRAGDPAAIPPGLRCPTDLTPGAPAGTDILFPTSGSTITAAHTRDLTAFMATWLAAGGTDDIIVHGYASTDGDQGPNWTLSCDRAEAVQAELIRLGIPPVRISTLAHGESTDFGATLPPNRHAVVATRAAGVVPLPLITGTLTPADNFAGRSATRFGVGEVINLGFASLPPRPAADFGGLEWRLVSGGGTLAAVTNAGTATYTAPAAAAAVQLELRVASGATAGRVISTHALTIVEPTAVNMTAIAGTFPGFAPGGGTIPAGTWGVGFNANVFVDPKDVSFQGVVFGEGTATGVVTPAGGFLAPFSGMVHPRNTFGPAHGGNSATGTAVSPPPDGPAIMRGPSGTLPLIGTPTCGAGDFLWAIPWEFQVPGAARTPFPGGFTANHHNTSDFFCNATIDKAGAGPFCRRINGTTC